MSWRSDGRPVDEGELDQVVCALTEVVAALAEEHAEMVRLLYGTVESQLSVLDALAALAASAAAPDVVTPGTLEATEPADTNEALRRETRQTVRHSGEITAQSRALITKAEATVRDAARLVSELRLTAGLLPSNSADTPVRDA